MDCECVRPDEVRQAAHRVGRREGGYFRGPEVSDDRDGGCSLADNAEGPVVESAFKRLALAPHTHREAEFLAHPRKTAIDLERPCISPRHA